LTLETKTFFGVAIAGFRETGRLPTFFAGLAAFVAFFFAGAAFLVESFFAADRGAAFCALRTGGFTAALAFGRAGLAFNVRPLTDDLVAGRRAAVREVERLNPFVMGLLMCGGLSI
jgi:hypothetical protein